MDYENGMNQKYHSIKFSSRYNEGVKLINDTKRFFHSAWFIQLSNEDGKELFKKIEENYIKYGTCMPFKNKEDLEE